MFNISVGNRFKRNLQDVFSERIAHIRGIPILIKLIRSDPKTEFLKIKVLDSENEKLKQ